MTLQAIPGGLSLFGPNIVVSGSGFSTRSLSTANHAQIHVGRLVTSDGGSHTLDTSGSSSIWWQTGGVTFASGSSSLSIGVSGVDASNGPPARATNSTGTVTFDVKTTYTGGGGSPAATSAITSVPTSGTKTMANGDLIAVSVQLTAKGGSDTINVQNPTSAMQLARPCSTFYNASSYFAETQLMPGFFITFADGAFGWIEGSEIATNYSTRSFNSSSSPKEYGQLYVPPFAGKVMGLYGFCGVSADCTLNLYSDPLGTPVSQKSTTIQAKSVVSSSANWFFEMFSSPYTFGAGQPLGAVFTPGGSSISAGYKQVAVAAHRIIDNWGTTGYGISRSSGAFANSNSSLDHYQIGLLVSAFDDATGGGGGGTVYGVVGG